MLNPDTYNNLTLLLKTGIRKENLCKSLQGINFDLILHIRLFKCYFVWEENFCQ